MDVFVREFVNRLPQLARFRSILAGRLDRRIYLIRGEEAIGKSFLLEQFRHMSGQWLYSSRDFRDEEDHDFLSIIHTIVDNLGYENFPDTNAVLDLVTEEARQPLRLKSEVVYRPEGIDRDLLLHLLTDRFNEVELIELAFDLEVDHELIPGQGKDAGEMIEYFHRRRRLPDLVNAGRTIRPDVPWDDVTRATSDNGSLELRKIGIYEDGYFLPHMMNRGQRRSFERSISLPFLKELSALAQRRAIILSFDSFEAAPSGFGPWLNKRIFAELSRKRTAEPSRKRTAEPSRKRSECILVIVSGTEIPELAVKYGLTAKTIRTTLENFDFETAKSYWVKCRELPADAFPSVFEETGGHPNALAIKANQSGGRVLEHQVMDF